MDDIIVFHPLSNEHLKEIAKLLLDDFAKRLSENMINFNYDDSVVEKVVKAGYDPKFGARPMKRAIQKLIENKIADEIIKGNITNNQEVKASIKNNSLVLE